MPAPKPTITVIRHHHSSAELCDVAATHLGHSGFAIDNRYPFEGDQLAIPKTGVTPTLVLGGGQNVTEMDKHPCLKDEQQWIEACLKADVPVFGICLGAQLLAHTLGSKISQRTPTECEFGFVEVFPTPAAKDWLPTPTFFMQAHYQEFSLPTGSERLAFSEKFEQQAFRYGDKATGVQFHPEVDRSIHSSWLSENWSDEMASLPGAQSKLDQRQTTEDLFSVQAHWFRQTLDQFFSPADLSQSGQRTGK